MIYIILLWICLNNFSRTDHSCNIQQWNYCAYLCMAGQSFTTLLQIYLTKISGETIPPSNSGNWNIWCLVKVKPCTSMQTSYEGCMTKLWLFTLYYKTLSLILKPNWSSILLVYLACLNDRYLVHRLWIRTTYKGIRKGRNI